MRVILAEKPSVGREIAHALGGFVKSPTNRFLTNQKDCIITWAIGHLVELHHPTVNDLSKLPILPNDDDWELRIIKNDGYQEQFDVIKKLFDSPQVTEVVNACDAGREGELIGRLIYDKSGTTKPLKRMWINSMTKDGLIKAYKNIKDSDEYEGLNQAARCRSKSDWVVGINGSIAATAVMSRKQYLSQITAIGRVKTPVLTMVVHRQREIDSFVSQPFWEIGAKFQVGAENYESKWVNYDEILKKQNQSSESNEASGEEDDEENSTDSSSSNRFYDRDKANAIVAACHNGKELKPVSKVIENKTNKKSNAPNLFDLTTIQYVANLKYKFSSKLTLELVQELYEKHKAVTYPRTESQHLPSDYPNEVARIFDDLMSKQKGDIKITLMAQEAKDRISVVGKHIFDDSKVTDHFAIIPTGTALDASASDAVKKIYYLIVERFKAAFLPPMEYSETERFTFIEDQAFRSVGKTIISKGWKALVETEEENGDKKKGKQDVILPAYQDKSEISPLSVALNQGKTTPPKPFTNGTLIRTMQNISRLLKGDQKKALKDCGIGTPATRANIIDDLLSTTANNGSPKKAMLQEVGSNKYIAPTEYGKQVVEFLEENGITSLTKPEFTANWELQLAEVNKDAHKSIDFMSHTHEVVSDFISKLQLAHKNMPVIKLAGCVCPECSSDLTLEPRYVICSDTTCRFKLQRMVADKILSDAELQVLINNKATGVISGFVKKADPKVKGSKSKTFSAALELEIKEDKTYHIKFFFPKTKYDLPCPICKSPMEGTVSGVACTDHEACKFMVWRTINEKSLSDSEIRILIQNGVTDVLEGFKSAKGNNFSGKLIVNHELKRVGFSFDGVDVANTGTESKDDCTQESCSGKYLISGNRYKCNTCDSWYTSKPKIALKPFSAAQMSKLFKGKTVTHAIKIDDGTGNEVNKKAEYYIDAKTKYMRYNILD
ncbi:type IA DNA topoisomerase [Acinetobacter baumannii]|uniref:type IA DNA topoisomerase n=1 Tax=Acinetobacter baumannii TaxID=470 RepID=UPI002740A679|nr:type IA DNA topoisomerase [Acinetobacter baumannii]MDP7849471.1 DNA topoisomerase [Acinetobacter baumannii]